MRAGGAVTRDLLRFGRFSEPALLILISLADGPKHGYAVMEDVARAAGVRLGAGTLYGALARLLGALAAHLHPELWRPQPAFERLSDSGRRVLGLAEEEARRLHHGYLGTEHVLLGLLREPDGAAARLLADLGIALEDVRSRV